MIFVLYGYYLNCLFDIVFNMTHLINKYYVTLYLNWSKITIEIITSNEIRPKFQTLRAGSETQQCVLSTRVRK